MIKNLTPSDYELDLPVYEDEVLKELRAKSRKGWVTISLSLDSAWVGCASKVWFKARYIYLMPLSENKPAYLAAKIIDNETYKDTYKILSIFLSSFSWWLNERFTIKEWIAGGSSNPKEYKGFGISMIIPYPDRDCLHEPLEENYERIALSLYREGLSLNHHFYGFLSFYKIINILHKGSGKQKEWINDHLNFTGQEAKERIKELREKEAITDIGLYLNKKGRNAIAHAGQDELGPTADPDDLNELERLRKDKILMKDLCAIAIQEKYNIKAPGFHFDGLFHADKLIKIFDPNFLEKGVIKSDIPYIRLKIKGKEPNQLTDRLCFPKTASIANNTIILDMVTLYQRATIRICIDKEKNNVFIPLNQPYKINLTNDIKTITEIEVDALTLMHDYLREGWLRIYTPSSELLASGLPPRLDLRLGRSISDLRALIEANKQKLESLA